MRRGLRVLTVAIVAAVLTAGVVSIAAGGPWRSGPVSTAEQVRSIGQTLKCPTCLGETVADSSSPVSAAMRAVIEEQVRDGRTAAEIRDWFALRYGEGVLLDPPLASAGWLLWAIPVLLVAVIVAVAVRRRGGSGWAAMGLAAAGAGITAAAWGVATLAGPGANPATGAAPGFALQLAVERDPGDAELRIAYGRALEGADRHAEAAEQYAAALRLDPLDIDLAYRYAGALARSGDAAAAAETLDQVLRAEPEHVAALLLRGTIAWDAEEPEAAELLQRFLDLAPGHPAAEEVEAMLATAEDGRS